MTGLGDTAEPSPRFFVCRPPARQDEEPCARKILASARPSRVSPAGDRSRRPASARLLSDRAKRRRLRGRHPVGARAAAGRRRTSCSASSAIRANVAPGTAYRISDLELASRLSFFLWSSIPDDELLDVAVRGRLKDPTVLEQQVRRMLADPQADGAREQFLSASGCCCGTSRLAAPDPDDVPRVRRQACARRSSARPSCSSKASCARIAASLELLTANYTFVNERLAQALRHPERVRQPLPARDAAATTGGPGLLGQGSILTVTSYAERGRRRCCAASGCSRTCSARRRRRRRPNVPPLEENDGARLRRRCASGWSSIARIRCARPATRDGSARLRARELRRDRQVADDRDGQDTHRCVGCAPGRHQVQRARRSSGRCSLEPP